MVIALGITVQGEKGGVGVCSDRDRERAGVDGVFAGVEANVVERGLRSEAGLLCVIEMRLQGPSGGDPAGF